jgi:hypothetical protein
LRLPSGSVNAGAAYPTEETSRLVSGIAVKEAAAVSEVAGTELRPEYGSSFLSGNRKAGDVGENGTLMIMGSGIFERADCAPSKAPAIANAAITIGQTDQSCFSVRFSIVRT